MRVIEIKSKKQENGMYGIPLKCYEMIGFPPISDNRKYMLFSAIIIAVDEKHNKHFNLRFYDDGFLIQLNPDPTSYSMSQTFFMRYDRYEYINDTLYEFVSDDERIVFLRKFKIRQLDAYSS